MHGVYLGGVFVAIRLGLEAGLSALIVSLQPLLVAAAAPLLLAERVGARTLARARPGPARRRPGPGPQAGAWQRRCAGRVRPASPRWPASPSARSTRSGSAAAQDLRTGNLIQFAAAAAACWLAGAPVRDPAHRLDAASSCSPCSGSCSCCRWVRSPALPAAPARRRGAGLEPVLPGAADHGLDRLAAVRRAARAAGAAGHGGDGHRRGHGQLGRHGRTRAAAGSRPRTRAKPDRLVDVGQVVQLVEQLAQAARGCDPEQGARGDVWLLK